MNNHACEYGCGQPAKYSPRKGMTKWCCSEKFNQCPGMIEKMNIKKRGRSWNEIYGKEQADKRREINSESMKLNNPMKNSEPWNKGLKNCYTEETLQKMRNQTRSHKGISWEDRHGKEKSNQLKKNLSEKISIRMKNTIPWNKDKKGCFNDDTKKQMSESHKKIWTKEKREEYSKYFTMKLKDYQKKYPFFCFIEELRENDNQEVEVRCKYCNKWFIPTPNQIKERLRQVENENGNMKTYMYCCKEHQYLCPCSIVKDPKLKTKYEKYVSIVWVITNQNIKKYNNKIKNIELRGLEFGYDLDHKYSISEGFKNNINPEIIGHYQNFQIIKDKLNRSKNRDCSISLQYLIKQINKNEDQNVKLNI